MCTYNVGKVFAAKTVMCYDYIKAIKASYSLYSVVQAH